jgi:hypothetical protein
MVAIQEHLAVTFKASGPVLVPAGAVPLRVRVLASKFCHYSVQPLLRYHYCC